ncbi:MAG: prephenate dehydrogenase [Anaerolineales bacterium]|nr:prephenate dehydrogenase [Anaerolineales bacterium]
MSDPDFFSGARVVIFGLGLMGGSLALGLRGSCRELAAVEINEETRKLADRLNIVDQISDDPSEVVRDADLIVLATPVKTIISLIYKITQWHPGAPVILDLGSTKTQICQAFDVLPQRFDTIGGHPMCGKEELGLENAEAAIFHGAPFSFVKLYRTSPKAVIMAEQLTSILGSHALWLDAETHDRWVAETSHLPYILASALALATSPEVQPMIGPGWRSTTRLASTPGSMMNDILYTNRQNILKSIDQFQSELDKMVSLLQEEEDQGLAEYTKKATQARNTRIQNTYAGGEG